MYRSTLALSLVLVFTVLSSSGTSHGQTERVVHSGEDANVEKSLNRYIHGTGTNDAELTRSAFYKDANLFLSHPERPLWIMTIGEYAERLSRGAQGEPNGRTGKVLSIDRHGDIASATAEIVLPDGRRFVDVFLLKRLDGQWKILSKAATQLD